MRGLSHRFAAIPGTRSPRLRLRHRLMIAVTLLLAGILVAAGMLIISNAKRAVADEMRSSVTLASDLIEASLRDHGSAVSAARRLTTVGHLRHLCLSLTGAASAPADCGNDDAPAPVWFTTMTWPDTLPERRIAIGADRAIRILADPNDEIGEAWQDTRGLLALMLIFYLAILAIVYRLLRRALVPVRRIDAALARIERGDYDMRLPTFSLPEFDGIAHQFNHMAERLAAARDENQRLRDHSLRIQEDERRNLARELHDELGQSLTAIRADAAGILARRDDLPPGVAESAEAIADVAARIYGQTRSMMRRLRPPGLDELGLDAALEEHVAGWRRVRPDVVFQYAGGPTLACVADRVAIHIFRLVQEAITNALRHGHPQTIRIALHARAHRLDVHVSDDGAGFDHGRQRAGIGLSGMAERIDLLAGHFGIDSAPGQGTHIVARIPLDTH